MAIANIIARGVGFSPGSVKWIVTHGFLDAPPPPLPGGGTSHTIPSGPPKKDRQQPVRHKFERTRKGRIPRFSDHGIYPDPKEEAERAAREAEEAKEPAPKPPILPLAPKPFEIEEGAAARVNREESARQAVKDITEAVKAVSLLDAADEAYNAIQAKRLQELAVERGRRRVRQAKERQQLIRAEEQRIAEIEAEGELLTLLLLSV